MKRPDITDPKKRGRHSSITVGDVFRSRPWQVAVWETKQYSVADSVGYDMFVRTKPGFLKSLGLDGETDVLSIQIKSDPDSAKGFIKQYGHEGRFFNFRKRYHQFILCGMDEPELVLADIVGQMVAQAKSFDIEEKSVLEYLTKNDDDFSVKCYKQWKVALIFRWYGHRLPPSN